MFINGKGIGKGSTECKKKRKENTVTYKSIRSSHMYIRMTYFTHLINVTVKKVKITNSAIKKIMEQHKREVYKKN